MNKIYVFLSCILIISCTANNQYFIESIQSYNQVDFGNIKDSSTLVLFDVDETLIQPEDSYLINEHSERALKFRDSLLKKHPELIKMSDIGGIIATQAKRPLIETAILDKINLLKKNNVKILAITAMNTGRYSTLARTEKWRYEHLKSLGFNGSYQGFDFHLPGFKRKPVFYKGIIATDLADKGPVLGAVLDKLSFTPNIIIMFDDSIEFLHSVAKECMKRHITFLGYHYKGSKKKAWDEELILFQAQYLLKNKKWLSDIKAKEKMLLHCAKNGKASSSNQHNGH